MPRLSSVLTLGILALLGISFGLATPIHLLELAHPNQKLLRLLAMEAPGTYHHSLLVANLAERAAEAIGADSLVLRVGAYYHDIGKVVRPGFPISSFDSFERTQAFANARGRRYVHVPPGVQARVVHREHKPLTLPSGDFEIRTQREMQGVGTRRRIQRVMD